MNLDPYRLTDNHFPLVERIRAFNEAIEKYGARDPHLLSFDLKVTPQIVIAYYELNVIEKEELEFLKEQRLDIGLISVLMNIEPGLRKKIYENLGAFVGDKRPVSKIIDFVNRGGGSMTIRDLYQATKKGYWSAVASYLKDTSTVSGTITKQFRAMLVSIDTYKASDKQLGWLERAIFHDRAEQLGVFTATTFETKFSESVSAVQSFIQQNKLRYGKT